MDSPEPSRQDAPSEAEERQIVESISRSFPLRRRQFKLLRRLMEARRNLTLVSHRQIAKELAIEREVHKNKSRPHFAIESVEDSCEEAGAKLLLRLGKTLVDFYASSSSTAPDWIVVLKDGVLSYELNIRNSTVPGLNGGEPPPDRQSRLEGLAGRPLTETEPLRSQNIPRPKPDVTSGHHLLPEHGANI